MPPTPDFLTPVLHVTDLEAAIAFFTTVLGFSEEFRYQDIYAGVTLGKVTFHLAKGSGPFERPIGGANVYIYLEKPQDVDAYYAEILAKGARVAAPPHDYPYGMRDFAAFDSDGNVITFGASTENAN